MRTIPRLRLLLCAALLAAPGLRLGAQNAIDEPDPFVIVGEKEGDDEVVAAPAVAEPADSDGEGGAGEGPVSERKPLSAQISQHIQKLAETERDTRMGFMKIVIDDIVRLCELDEAQREQLVLAAKGAAERSMKQWHEQAERYFRTRLESADPDTAKEMLEGMGSVNFGGNRSEEEGESLDLWKDALKTVLTPQQIERYEEVLERRHLDRIDAFARMSLSTLDDHLRLTPDQRAKLSEIVQTSATDYLEDVQRYWGDYFERGMLMSLVNAAGEDELKSVLTEQQYNRLREATSNFDHFWDQKRRLRRAKEKASERRKNTGEEAGEGAPAAGPEPPAGVRGEVRIEGGAVINGAVINGAVIDGKAIIGGAVIGGGGGGVIRIQGNGIRIQSRPAAGPVEEAP